MGAYQHIFPGSLVSVVSACIMLEIELPTLMLPGSCGAWSGFTRRRPRDRVLSYSTHCSSLSRWKSAVAHQCSGCGRNNSAKETHLDCFYCNTPEKLIRMRWSESWSHGWRLENVCRTLYECGVGIDLLGPKVSITTRDLAKYLTHSRNIRASSNYHTGQQNNGFRMSVNQGTQRSCFAWSASLVQTTIQYEKDFGHSELILGYSFVILR